jgi:hypothetical protein
LDCFVGWFIMIFFPFQFLLLKVVMKEKTFKEKTIVFILLESITIGMLPLRKLLSLIHSKWKWVSLLEFYIWF